MAKKYGELKHYDIIFEGILKKSPPQKPRAFFNFITKFSCTSAYRGSLSPLNSKWKKRHFVLYKTFRPNQVCLLYFKVDLSPDYKAIGDIDLTRLSNVSADVGSSVNRSNVFSIQTNDDKGDHRIYFLCAQSFELMNQWVTKIVSSLSLNGNSSIYNSVATLPSPVPQNRIRSQPKVTQHYLSSPKSSSAVNSFCSLSEATRFSFSTANERSSDATETSYYNLSPGNNSCFQEHLEDPISTDEEDIYKNPFVEANQHAYVNLDKDEPTPSASKTELSGDLFFTNEDNIFRYSYDEKRDHTISPSEMKSTVDHITTEYQNLAAYQSDCQSSNLSTENKLKAQDLNDFDFALPTRIRSESTSSSSSSCSSSSSTNCKDYKSQITTKEDSFSPPRVPKRHNFTETNKNLKEGEDILPIKPPKANLARNESSDTSTTFTDDAFNSLNYVDATNLLLGNREKSKSESNYASLDVLQNPYNNFPMSPLQSKCSDTNSIHCDTPSNIEDCLTASMFSLMNGIKTDTLPSVEYREICNTRTEALLKLNVRIQKNN